MKTIGRFTALLSITLLSGCAMTGGMECFSRTSANIFDTAPGCYSKAEYDVIMRRHADKVNKSKQERYASLEAARQDLIKLTKPYEVAYYKILFEEEKELIWLERELENDIAELKRQIEEGQRPTSVRIQSADGTVRTIFVDYTATGISIREY